MSVQDLTPNLDEAAAEPEDLILRRLVRAIDYAEGFWLGFAKSNTPAQRRRLAALCKDLLEPLKIRVLEIDLTEPISDLLPILRERLAQEHATHEEAAPPTKDSATTDDARATTGEASAASQPKLAIFVYGLERSIPSREAYPPLLSSLNLNRELFRQQIPHPLLLWLPDYALTALARKAPDFWAWRSGLYEFPPERETAEQSLKAVRGEALHLTDSLSEQAKRERLVMLKGLLDDYRELGDGPREQNACASILTSIGLIYIMLGEWAEAKQALEETLIIGRKTEDVSGEASALFNLAVVADYQQSLEEARRFYSESLKIEERLGNQSGIALGLWGLGNLSLEKGDYEEAKKLYQEALGIFGKLGDQVSVASILHQIGRIAQEQGELEEAAHLYDESLEIAKRLGAERGVAISLHQLGRLAESDGDKVKAARLFREALSILERLGSPDAEIARRSLARAEGEGKVSD